MPFKIATLATGPDPLDWDTFDTLGVIEPDALYQPYAEVVPTLAGGSFGRGFASVILSWKEIHNAQRKILRTYCPGASAQVYLSVPINEDDSAGDPEFRNFLVTLHWPPGQEDKNVRHTLELDLTCTHLVEVV